MGTMAEYFAGLASDQREALQRVVDVATQVAPDAEEGTSYGMPALLVGGRPLIGVTASAKHLSVFPFSPAVVEAVAADLPGYALSKGTVRFSADRPVPDEVIAKMVRLRLAELSA